VTLMPFNESSMDSFGSLVRAIGLTNSSGTNGAWFKDPVGGSPDNANGLKTVLANQEQRDALVTFVDEVLGPPALHRQGEQRWIPLFAESDPNITVYAVLEPVVGAVRIGVGVEHVTGTTTTNVKTTVHVPIFHVPRDGADSRPSGGPLPTWSLLGKPGGRIVVSVDALFDPGPPTPGQAFLGGASVSLGIPTSDVDTVDFSLTLKDLQLPGAATPQSRTLDVDSLDEIGTDVFEFIVGIVRQQIDSLDLNDTALRHIKGLAGILGLRDITSLPPLPIADLPAQGLRALVDWIEAILNDDTALDVWLGELGRLVGGTTVPDRNAVELDIGAAHLFLGLRVTPGAGGHPVLVPWVELSWSPTDGAELAATVDILRADTATGHVQAVPGLRAQAVFGAEAHNGSALLTGTPGVGTLRTGLALDEDQRPSFVLTMHDVDMPGGRHHDLLDLSSPDAALDAAGSVVSDALGAALDGFGDVGALLKEILGVQPPTGVPSLQATALLADPLGAIKGYWLALLGNASAMAQVLGSLRALLTGTPSSAVPGTGDLATPWRIDVADGIGLRLWREASVLVVALGADVLTPIFDDLAVATKAEVVLLRADLDLGHVSLACGASGQVLLRPAGSDPIDLDLDVATLHFSGVGIQARWAPGLGLRATVLGDGLSMSFIDPHTRLPVQHGIPLPTIAPDGTITFAPDWDAVEGIVTSLLARASSEVITILMDLLGWRGTGAHLRLSALIANPADAIATWATGVALDCSHLYAALGPVAQLLSGGRLNSPLGAGSPSDPYRCPVAGEPRAPGLTAWTVPGCPPRRTSIGDSPSRFTDLRDGILLADGPGIAAALGAAAPVVPELADLLVARTRIGAGLTSLLTRWAGTDGVVGAPTTMPPDVTSVVLEGFSYAELVAAGRVRAYVLGGVVAPLDAVVHVGTASDWLSGQPSASAVDATAATPTPIPATANGEWFVLLPTPSAAAALRPDHDAVAAQADKLAAVLAARTAPVVVVAYGASGAAAIRAAGAQTQVSTVVTVGSPWSPVSVLALSSGLGGDALRFLDRLVPQPLPQWSDLLTAHGCTPLRRAWSLVRHSVETSGPSDLPSAGAETRRVGLDVHAVFGSVASADVARGVAALVVGGVEERSQAADLAALATSGPPDELHVGLDMPVFDLDLGGLLVGAGVAIDLVSVHHAIPHVRPQLGVVATVRMGVTDGWLVGGPGATQNDLELRWLEARIHIPLDGSAGTSELVLHEAKAFTSYRERWVVRSDADGVDATTALPEVKILLSEIATRVRTASPDLADLLTHLGILRSAGLDADAIDLLLFDPVSTLRPVVAAHAAELAGSLRNLIGLPTPGLAATAFRAGFGDAHVDVDLAAGSVSGAVTVTVDGLPPLALGIAASHAGVTATAALGEVDPTVGGLRLVGSAGTSGASLSVENRAPGATSSTTVGLYPSVDTGGLVTLAQTVLPAVVIQAVATACRSAASDTGLAALESAYGALGLLSAARPNGSRDILLPVGLLADPGVWLRQRVDPFAAVVAVMEALAPVVVPTRGAGVQGWPLTDDLTILYAVAAGQLQLTATLDLDATIDGRTITTAVTGGLSIATSGVVQPVVDASVLVDQTGLRLRVAPTPTLDLVRETPATPIRLYPAGPGIGQAIGAAAESVVRIVLNTLVDHRSDVVASPAKAVGSAVHELGVGMDLLVADHFTDAKIATFADNPASALLNRLPYLVSSGLTALADALDPGHTKVTVFPEAGGRRRITFGTGAHFHIELDGGAPAIELGCEVDLFDATSTKVGRIVVEKLRLTPTGIQLDMRGGPFVINAGPMTLRPVIVARAGVTSGGGSSLAFSRLLGLGLALDDSGSESIEFRWTLDNLPPTIAAVSRNIAGAETGAVTDLEAVALKLLGLAVSLASTILTEKLGTVVTARATAMLQDVVFTGGDRSIDASFFTDLTNPEALLRRLKALAWNCATDPHHAILDLAKPLSVTIDDTVTIGFAVAEVDGGQKQLGLNVSLATGKKFEFPTSDVKVALEVDASWISPHVDPGLSIYVLKGADIDHLDLVPGFAIAGIGMRFTKTSGPLLELGSIALDGIAFHVYAEADSLGVGGGANIELVGLAVAPGGSGSGVANNIMNDVGSASANNRPVFSPSLAIQKHPGPGQHVGVSLRAGEPPGPWWIVIQRQLGPLYVDRIGFNTIESGGKVTEISLLFNGQLSLFGLTAAVDQLMIKWNGGDVLSISSWSVDLMGLAISADMAGVSLAGGLLKTDDNGVVSYVGMLVGRFAAYGLSVFGGYTNDHGNASFFLFGAINGPIGGPPAFFLTGIGGGLGINRGLVIPTDLSQFGTFPFIQALDPGARPPARPMDELHRLSAFFPHQMGSFWFAAGISFTCFSLVDGVAVVAVSFGNGLDINLLGLARMALPRPGAAIVSIELALLARFSTSEGLFMIKAQLTDNSWLLYEDVRLTGGFVFATWWKGPLAGQFVLSMGGYHPSFHRDGYPDVPRLGIMWRISDALVIKGGSYFALTSEALMAGVGVEASLDLGWVWARVAFGADGIVYFDPFWFEVSAYARISAGIELDLGLFSISLSISLGATIKVWGPDFAGRVEFEIGPCTIPVSFGSERKVAPELLGWDKFRAKYLEDGGTAARALSSITGKGSLPTSTGGATGAPSADGSEALPFQVFAEFEITFTTTIPTSTFDVGTASPVAVPVTISGGQPVLLGLSPMGAHNLASTLMIRLDLLNPTTHVYERVDTRLARLAQGFGGASGSRYSSDFFPLGVWGTPQDPNLRVKPLPSGDVVSAGKQVVLVAGVDMPGVGPDIDYHQVRADRRPLPLLATGNDRKSFLKVAGKLPTVDASTATEALTFAAGQMFADRMVAGTMTARGGHSALAQAAFVQDRSAPPMFGTLTDGLAPINGESGGREVLTPTGPFEARLLRRPFVAGYLTGGVGAAVRPGATTVADGRLKRRPAPTVDSVQGRLALHLPVSLSMASVPAVASAGTLIACGAVPRTDAPGSMRSYAGGRIGSSALQDLVAGLTDAAGPGPKRSSAARSSAQRSSRRSPRAESMVGTVRSGDLLVLQCPDSAIDVDPERRPSLAVTGRARVTVILGRTVLVDDDVIDGSVSIPFGATHIGIQADGLADPTGGLAGWHDRSRVARIGSQSAIAAGCVLSVDAAVGGPILQWDSAGAVVHHAREVTTRFSRPVTTVAVALTGSAPTSLAPTQLHLVGARVATDRSGAERLPVAVTLGDTSVLVYAVVPDKGATSVSVIVSAGADWVVSGVVGTTDAPQDVARLIARQRLAGVTAKLLALAGKGCGAEWHEAPKTRPRRPRKAPR